MEAAICIKQGYQIRENLKIFVLDRAFPVEGTFVIRVSKISEQQYK